MNDDFKKLILKTSEVWYDNTDIFQLDDGTIVFYTNHTEDVMGKLFVKKKGTNFHADMPNRTNKHMGVHGNNIYFKCKVDSTAYIYKAEFISNIVAFVRVRSVLQNECTLPGALCSRKNRWVSYVYRMCDDPHKDAIRLPDSVLEQPVMQNSPLLFIHRGKAYFGSYTRQVEVTKLSENVLMIQHDNAGWYVRESSNYIYVAVERSYYSDNSIHRNLGTAWRRYFVIYAISTDTMKILQMFRTESFVKQIVGEFDGILTVKCVSERKADRYSLYEAQLPPGYFSVYEENNTDSRSSLPHSEHTIPVNTTTETNSLQDTTMKLSSPQMVRNEQSNEDTNTLHISRTISSPNPISDAFSSISVSESSIGGSTEFSSKFLNEFMVENILGEGAFGCVFGAVNNIDTMAYAVKRVAVDKSIITSALGEVRKLARLDHNGIVRYYGSWIEEPPIGWQHDTDVEILKRLGSSKRRIMNFMDEDVFIYIQMQLCKYSLLDWLKNNQTASSRTRTRMKSWFKQIVGAVDYIHSNNLIHRDLKPSNILFANDDNIKLCDLGIATERNTGDNTDTALTRSWNSGTMLYMSPEQLSLLPYSSKTDVFTLGLVLAELLKVMTPTERSEIFVNYRRGKGNKNLFSDTETEIFIENLTDADPKKRPSCQKMLVHSFFK